MTRALLLGPLALSLLALGCGPEFDPSNEIKALRVMGVKKDRPYAQPGEEVSLQLLWHDPEGRDDSEIQRAWIGGCVNPPGDLYYGCFLQYGQIAAQGGVLPFGGGDSFKVTLPPDIVSSRGGPIEPGQPRYGLYIVFFALCAGQLEIAMEANADAAGSTGLPIRCLDEHGDPLDSEDFIVGYTSIYSFEGVQNQNPTFSVVDGRGEFSIAGQPAPADCLGAECQGAPAVEVDCEDADEARCIEACADDGEGTCPAIDVAPSIEQIVEPDDVTSAIYGSEVDEQMWVNYYLDRGAINEVRLLNDSASGWNEKYRGQLRAPKDPGPLQVWAVAHDNRGGMEWSRITLQVR